jgi:hypothetical protein
MGNVLNWRTLERIISEYPSRKERSGSIRKIRMEISGLWERIGSITPQRMKNSKLRLEKPLMW